MPFKKEAFLRSTIISQVKQSPLTAQICWLILIPKTKQKHTKKPHNREQLEARKESEWLADAF